MPVATTHAAASRVAGTAAVCLVLGASRWGTYIGMAPLFLTDVLIALAVWAAFLRWLSSGKVASSYRTPSILALFLVWISIRAATTFGRDPVLEWARDVVPYFYVALAVLSAASIARGDDRTLANTWRWIKVALFFHAAWALPQASAARAADVETGYFTAPFIGAPVGQIRPDIDAALLAVTAGLLLRALLLGKSKHPFPAALGFVACSAGVVLIYSRAGLIAYVATILMVLYLAAAAVELRRRGIVLLMSAAILVAGLAILPSTTPGQRLLAPTGLVETDAALSASAAGTQRARIQTWSRVNDWSGDDPIRRAAGGGFGNDFLTEAGALRLLEGDTYENVRSPHNYAIGVLARLGVVGLLLLLGVSASLLLALRRGRRRIGEDPVLSTAALLVAAILPISLIGVVLESPFGAVPFWWATGLIYFAARADRPAPMPRSVEEPTPATTGGRR